MKPPKIGDLYSLLYDQMLNIKDASTADELDTEIKRAGGLAMTVDAMANLADKELKAFAQGGLPTENGLIIRSGSRLKNPNGSPLIEEFTKD